MEAVAHGRRLRKVRLIPFESHYRIEKAQRRQQGEREREREGEREKKKSGVGPCGFPFTRESADM